MTSLAMKGFPYLSLVLIVMSPAVNSESQLTVKSLCDDPYIFSANRLPNDTYRVYRGNHYWELIGLPDRVAEAKGPYKITNKYMGPITRYTTIMTLVNGTHSGHTFKFEKESMWEWDPQGNQLMGQANGVSWYGFPKYGFNCAMNDGGMDDKNWKFPRMIAFQGVRVFYWNTKTHEMQAIGDYQNGYVGGNYGEKFPSDLTACMAFKMNAKKAKFFVYLFKRDKYCFRPVVSVNGCNEWRDNRELFGCKSAHPPVEHPPPAPVDPPEAHNPQAVEGGNDSPAPADDTNTGKKTSAGMSSFNSIQIWDQIFLLFFASLFGLIQKF